MELTGKYTVGSSILNKQKEPVEGLYVFGKYGFPFLCSNLKEKIKSEDSIYVFEDAETAQSYIRYLSRRYRYEFRDRAKRMGVPTGEFRFYLIKLTDKMFNDVVIGRTKSHKIKVRDDQDSKYRFHGDYSKVTIQSIELKE